MNKNQLKKIRLTAGLTQAQLAELFGLSGRSRICEYESGIRNPSGSILKLYELVENKVLQHPCAKNSKSAKQA